jgi:HEAT repeat protein
MGRTQRAAFFPLLTKDLTHEKEENLPALLYALGLLKDPRAVDVLAGYLDHSDSRIRSQAVVSLGNIGDPSAKEFLKKCLLDREANVKWGASLSLAYMGDASGKEILEQLLSRDYLSQFPEVDFQEQNHLVLSAIEATGRLKFVDTQLLKSLQKLATGDKNMKVRGSAMKLLESLKERNSEKNLWIPKIKRQSKP